MSGSPISGGEEDQSFKNQSLKDQSWEITLDYSDCSYTHDVEEQEVEVCEDIIGTIKVKEKLHKSNRYNKFTNMPLVCSL